MKYYGVYVETASRVLKVISITALLYCRLRGSWTGGLILGASLK